MKIAIVSFGHVDSILSLSRYLGKIDSVKVDLYLIFSQKYLSSSVLNLSESNLDTGLVGTELTRELLGTEIKQYIEDYMHCKLFIYRNASLCDRRNFLLSYQLAQYIKKEKYDVIHFNGTSGFLIFLHHFLRKLPRVNTVHDPIPHSGEASWFSNALYKLLFRYKIEFILHSKNLAEEFIKKYKVERKNVHSIYYGALEIYKLFGEKQIAEAQNVILFFGRISPYKGIEYLIEASKIVRNTIPDLKVVIVGNGEYYFNVQNSIHEGTIEIVNRYITNGELSEFIQRASLVVCPYTDATQSGVVMTAYAFDKPVVASNVGGLSEIIEHDVTGKLVPPKDAEALAKAILDLLHNPDKLMHMSENIHQKCSADELSWHHIAAKTLDVYRMSMQN